MFRNNRFGGLLAAILILSVLAIVGFAAFQMGVARGAGAEFVHPYMMERGYAGHGFMFFPFFWGFGLLKLFFWLVLISVFIRIIFRITGWRGRSWGHGPNAMQNHWQEMHDRWHAEAGQSQAGQEPPSAE